MASVTLVSVETRDYVDTALDTGHGYRECQDYRARWLALTMARSETLASVFSGVFSAALFSSECSALLLHRLLRPDLLRRLSVATELATASLATRVFVVTALEAANSVRTALRTASLRTSSAPIQIRNWIAECQLLLVPHGLRFAFGRKPFMAALARPASEVGPVLSPPWSLHRPFS